MRQGHDAVAQSADHLPVGMGDDFQVLNEAAASSARIFADGRTHPDEAVVAQDDAGTAWQIVEVSLLSLDE